MGEASLSACLLLVCGEKYGLGHSWVLQTLRRAACDSSGLHAARALPTHSDSLPHPGVLFARLRICFHENEFREILKINGNNGADFDNDLKTPQNKSAPFVFRPASD